MDIFSALSDPTRRTILEMLAKNGSLSATDICAKFPVSPPAISQHLKVLREAKLVLIEKRAQQRMYQINPYAMFELEGWTKYMTQLWKQRFDALDTVLEAEKKKTLKLEGWNQSLGRPGGHLGQAKGEIIMVDNNENLTAVPDMKLELVPVPVSDVDRARAFYVEKAGFTLEVDVQINETMRVVQLTPPGSACSIVFGTGMGEITDMQPGSVKGLHLVVADIHEAREALVKRGLEVGEVSDVSGVMYAGFSDPDGNLWLLQEFPPKLRQPGQSFSK